MGERFDYNRSYMRLATREWDEPNRQYLPYTIEIPDDDDDLSTTWTCATKTTYYAPPEELQSRMFDIIYDDIIARMYGRNIRESPESVPPPAPISFDETMGF